MAKNYVQDSDKLLVLAPYAVASGAGALVGSLFGVAEGAAANGAPVNLVLDGVHTLVKATGQVWTVGLRLYWDDAAKNVTSTVSTNKLIGVAAAAAVSGALAGNVLLTKAFTL